MNVKIGTAPDSWGIWFPSDPHQVPWQRFLDEVVESGYDWIELGPPGYLPTDLTALRSELNQRGLKAAGRVVMGHLEDAAAWPEIEAQTLAAEYLVLIDESYTDLVTSQPTAAASLDESEWQRLIEATHKVAEIVRNRFGLRLVFHAEPDTHVEYEEQIERLLEQTDPDKVALCLDTGHHAYRGGDPVAFMRKHHQWIDCLHIKSVDPEVLKRVQAESVPFAKAVGMGVYSELALGAVDILGLRDVLRDIGYDGFAIVEQDMYPAPLDKPLPIAKRNRAYLHEIGFG